MPLATLPLPRPALLLRLLLAASVGSPLAFAQEAPGPAPGSAACNLDMFEQDETVTCLSDDALAQLRGGFLADGILIGFGFERLISIDGEVREYVAAAFPAFNLSDEIRIVPANRLLHGDRDSIQIEGLMLPSTALHDSSAASYQLVDSSSALSQMMSSIIQNSVDETTIEQYRSISIEIFGLGATANFDPQQHLIPGLIEGLGQ